MVKGKVADVEIAGAAQVRTKQEVGSIDNISTHKPLARAAEQKLA